VASNSKTRRLTSTAGVRGERGKLSIQFLSILSVLKLEASRLGGRGRDIWSRLRGWDTGGGCVGGSWPIRIDQHRVVDGTTTRARILSDIDELLAVWDRAVRTGGAGARRTQRGRTPERDRAWAPDGDSADKGLGLSACKLALEQS
jgi:hypothetical protein